MKLLLFVLATIQISPSAQVVQTRTFQIMAPQGWVVADRPWASQSSMNHDVLPEMARNGYSTRFVGIGSANAAAFSIERFGARAVLSSLYTRIVKIASTSS
ncbi:MAG: hypothetical protein DMG12_00760 [Acidobacteria bacterium]|nr:MAG: hypothetical protein DMG12_00760 [Acidobacteriota bacterium]